jgi:predicted O-linked N-acetylglucosamine transferase (SPINDLY family)
VFTPVPGLGQGEVLKATSPLAMLSASDDPGLQLATSIRFITEKVNLRVPRLAPEKGYRHDKLRIGFLSSDFCLHAVSLLTVELLELLDRDRFEVYGFCWSREDGSALRARVVKSFDHYVRIAELDDASAARAIREAEIDVVVDLQGITSGARPDIIAHKPAPVQITYLGFPGPTGHPCIDYVVADRFLIPDAERPFYTETPLYLPHVFQCSDRQRPVAPLPSRAQCGLPEDGFVFCSFNNNYKFTEEVFASWMRMLQAVPGSVLWLLADNPWSQASLTRRAGEHGVDPARLLFAPRVSPEQYLARYTAADLFLDAYPFNAGTTANDALWMGLPVLTRSGRTFASRMAGSLLTALDLPELITTTLADYEARAIEIATQPALHADLKQRLKAGRTQSPLFDMPRFVQDFGDAVERVALRG